MNLCNDITHYLETLNKEHNLQIAVCRQHWSITDETLLSYCAHWNPYCSYLKKNTDVQKNCLLRQNYVFEKAKEHDPLFGVCSAGVAEFVFPVIYKGEEICMLCVSGYAADKEIAKEKIAGFAARFGLDELKMKDIYFRTLKKKIPSLSFIRSVIHPVIHMLRLLFIEKAENPDTDGTPSAKDMIYREMLNYISLNFANKFSMSDIASNLNYSASYLWKVFISYNKNTPMEYANLIRIEKAKELLTGTSMKILDVAYTVGYNDSNYFTNVFHKHCGISPSQFRKLNRLIK